MNDDNLDLNQTILDLRGGFTRPGLPPISASMPAVAKFAKMALDAGKGIATDKIAQSFSVSAQEATDFVETVISIASATAGSMSNDGSGPTIRVSPPMEGGGPGSGHRLDYNVSPVEIDLNTGLTVNAFTEDFRSYKAGYFSPLHVNFNEIKILASTSTDLGQFWASIVNNQLSTAVQRAISFGASSSVLAPDAMMANFNVLIRALSVYLFWDGVISFCQKPGNRNDGMQALRANITPTDINNLNNLRWLLSSVPIPPNLRTLVYWYYQTYSQSSLPGSSLIINSPESLSTGGVMQNTISNQITALSTTTFRDFITLMSKACPNWVIGKLDSGNSDALHDPNFTTLFSNAAFVGKGSSDQNLTYYPVAGSDATYATWTNELDGAVTGLLGFWNGSVYLPGIVSPNVQVYGTTFPVSCNKFSYLGGGFQPTNIVGDLRFGRGDVFNLASASSTSSICFTTIPPGCQYLRGVNYTSCLQTCLKLLEWMMSLETIGTIVDNKVYGTQVVARSASPKGRNKKYYKGKGSKK